MKEDLHKKLGERELDILEALWQLKSATVAQVQEFLRERGNEVAYTTVQTMLNRLEAKKVVKRNDSDSTHRYIAVLKQPNAAESALKRLTERFFGGSAEALVTRLVEKELNAEQLERIQSMIDAHKKGK
jgi:predicted transcriptional regulator